MEGRSFKVKYIGDFPQNYSEDVYDAVRYKDLTEEERKDLDNDIVSWDDEDIFIPDGDVWAYMWNCEVEILGGTEDAK